MLTYVRKGRECDKFFCGNVVKRCSGKIDSGELISSLKQG
jgi:hypothetical protein